MDWEQLQAALQAQFQKSFTVVEAGLDDIRKRIKAEADLREDLERKVNMGRVQGKPENGWNPDERKSFELALRAYLGGDQHAAYKHFGEAKAMLVGSDPSGGWLVHPQWSMEWTRIFLEVAPFASEAREVNLTTGDAFEEPVDRLEAGASWVGEVAARPDTTRPDIGLFRCPLQEIYAMPKVSQKILDTTEVDIVTWLGSKVAEQLAFKESTAFHSGDGVVQPRGFLTYPVAAMADPTRPWGTIEYVVTGASGAFKAAGSDPADCLINLVAALKPQYRTGARFYMNRSTEALVRKIKDSEGRYLVVDSLQEANAARLLGYPITWDEQMPDPAANSLSIAFGNMKRGYTIIRKPGMKLLTDPYTDKPNVRLFWYQRTGGGVNNFEAIKFLKFGTT